jgi:hypothetical protein
MDCISCNESEVLNRAVVNQLTRHAHGLFCEACETERFGELLERSAWHQDNGCAFCDRNGRFALPRLDCVIEHGDDTPPYLEYESLEQSVRLCEAHVEELVHPEKTIKRTIEA